MKRNRILILIAYLFCLLTDGVFSPGFCEFREHPLLITKSVTIDRDLEFAQTAFVIKGSNIILDLGGRTITFNAANFSEAVNRDFEDWEGNRPIGWNIITGKVRREPASYFGKYDLILSPGGSIESAPIRLKAGKTYLAFAFAKGSENDRVVLSILKAEDRSVLGERTWGSSILSRGYASRGSVDTDLVFKPRADLDVVLKFHLIGTSVCRIGMVDIKPAFDYGVIANNYHESIYLPDLNPKWFQGASKNIIIRNGKIVQGNGHGVRSAGIRASEGENWRIENVEIYVNGINTDGISGEDIKNILIDSSKIESSSHGVFNRMHGNAGIKLNKTGGSTIITNSSITNVPQMGISIYGCFKEEDQSRHLVSGNIIKQKEIVTEGYGIAISGLMNCEISGNSIEPYQGRGILIDAASGCSTGFTGTLRGKIYNNRIINLFEVPNFEYDANSLECTGIRIRNWGEKNQSHKELQIFNNKISGRTDAGGVYKIYGINVTVSSPDDSIDIFKNEISVTAEGPGRTSSALIFQNTNVNGSNYVYARENKLSSNSEIIRFGGNDGPNVKGVLIEGNTMIRLTTPVPVGKPFAYGYWTGTEFNNVWAKNIPQTSEANPSLRQNISFEGTGIKYLMIGKHKIEVVVRSSRGPVAGATVSLKDKGARLLLERVTDISGKTFLYSPYTYYVAEPPAAPIVRKFLNAEAFTITISFKGVSKNLNIVADQDKIVEIFLN